MTIELFAIIFISTTFIFLLSGIPAGFVLSGNALLFSLLGSIFGFFDYSYLQAIPNRIFGIMSNQNLLAVPMFIYMGLILEKTKRFPCFPIDNKNLENKRINGDFRISEGSTLIIVADSFSGYINRLKTHTFFILSHSKETLILCQLDTYSLPFSSSLPLSRMSH